MTSIDKDHRCKASPDFSRKLGALVGSLPGLRDQETSPYTSRKKRTYALDTKKAYLHAFSFGAVDKVEKMFKAVLGKTLFEISSTATANSAGKHKTLTYQDLKRAKIRSICFRAC